MDSTIKNSTTETTNPLNGVVILPINDRPPKQSAKRRAGKLPTNLAKKPKDNPILELTSVDTSDVNRNHQSILNKYKNLIRQARESTTDIPPTTQELLSIIRQWEPKRDIICLYVRWARQLPKNFALDSIATLLCLADQCNYTPLDFLLKVKTLNVSRSNTSYGISLSFDLKPTKDGEALSKQFLGLSVTLALLQANITNSNGILGKNKMRSKAPRLNQAMTVGLGATDDNQATFQATPQVEFHTGQALTNRLWRCIIHRWISLYILEHLFRPKAPSYWNHQDALIYSFQMFANAGRSRYDYLAPLAGLCLHYIDPKHDIESNRDQLHVIWQDPDKLVPHGNTFLTTITEKEKISIITSTFLDVARVCPKKCSYDPRHQPLEKRWLMLRAFVFHFWLDQTKNQRIRTNVISNLKPSNLSETDAAHKKSLKTANAGNAPAGNSKPTIINATTVPTPQNIHISPIINSARTAWTKNDLIQGGLESLQSTRTLLEQNPEPVMHCVGKPPTGREATEMIRQQPNDISNFNDMSLAHPQTMRNHVSSYLIIHTEDGIDVVSKLAPIEVYSADNLYMRQHGRFTGDESFYPSNNIGDIILSVGANAKCFIDRNSRYFHIAREGSSYLLQHGRLLPTMAQLKSVCMAVVTHGKHDMTRSSGQFRVNIGCGGQDRRDGAPCHLHDSGFQQHLEADPQFDSDLVRKSIGQCTEMVWKICQDMQRDANDSPMAQDHIRSQLYSRHLAKYLLMNEEVGFEDVTIVFARLHPFGNDVLYHVDSMNDSVAGYTRTCSLNIALELVEDGKTTVVQLQVRCRIGIPLLRCEYSRQVLSGFFL